MQRPTLIRLFTVTILVGLLAGCASSAKTNGEAPRPTRTTATMADDQLIESSAADKLYSEPELGKKIHINITSYNRIVLLTGETLTRETRDYVVDVVRNLPNVRRVHNEIRIKNLTGFSSRSKDGWITSKIKTHMLTAKGFDSDSVKVITEEGTVFLLGMVTRAEGKRAAEITRNINGVQQVVKLFEYID